MDNFKVIRLLGEGSFGKVWLCTKKTKGDVCESREEKYAVKVVNPKLSWEECLKLREVRSLQKLGKHRYIVCLHQVIRSKTKGDFLNLVFDYHPSNLYKEIKKARNGKAFFSHERVITWTFELLSAVAHAHKNGFFHRDIKPENILVDSKGSFQLCDFGLAREIRSTPPYTPYVSTRWYRAPELILRASKYNSPVDIWASACVVVEICTLRPLFPAKDTIDQLYQICSLFGPIDSSSWSDGVILAKGMKRMNILGSPQTKSLSNLLSGAPPGIHLLVSQMFKLDPDKRMSAAQCLCSEMFQALHDQDTPKHKGPEKEEDGQKLSLSRRRLSQRTNSQRLEELTKEVNMLLSYEQKYGNLDQAEPSPSSKVDSSEDTESIPAKKLEQDNLRSEEAMDSVDPNSSKTKGTAKAPSCTAYSHGEQGKRLGTRKLTMDEYLNSTADESDSDEDDEVIRQLNLHPPIPPAAQQKSPGIHKEEQRNGNLVFDDVEQKQYIVVSDSKQTDMLLEDVSADVSFGQTSRLTSVKEAAGLDPHDLLLKIKRLEAELVAVRQENEKLKQELGYC